MHLNFSAAHLLQISVAKEWLLCGERGFSAQGPERWSMVIVSGRRARPGEGNRSSRADATSNGTGFDSG